MGHNETPTKEKPMFDENTETEETTESIVPTVKTVAKCAVLGAATYVVARNALLYYRLRKARLEQEAAESQKPVAMKVAA
jgi:hypothetical protein